jgi:aminopeptidase N
MPSSNELFSLFSDNVYNGGALVLYALYQRVGADTFYEIERRWARRYSGESVTTRDFIELVVRVARDRSLAPFLEDWVYGTTIPPMPGHPDWEAAPAGAPAPAAAALSARGLELAKR